MGWDRKSFELHICKGGELTKAQAFGIAGFLNSALVDGYFRSISGNTQVNAAEIRLLL